MAMASALPWAMAPAKFSCVYQNSSRIFPPIVRKSPRRLGFQQLDWINKDETLAFAVSKNLNAESSFDTRSRDEVAPYSFHLEDEDDDEEDGVYYDDDGFELRDNNEEDNAAVAVEVQAARGGYDRERLQELCARVLASGNRTVTAGDIANLYDFPFDKFQVIFP